MIPRAIRSATLPALALLVLTLAPATAPAQSDGQPRYISDVITLTIRDAPRNDATYLGVVRSGQQVRMLETLGEQSFARIRLDNGTEGWVTARYLSETPAARDQLDQISGERDQARAQISELESELAETREQLARARPALQMASENDELRATIERLEQEQVDLVARYDETENQRRMMVTGATLVGGGVLGGLVLPWLGTGRRKRRNEL